MDASYQFAVDVDRWIRKANLRADTVLRRVGEEGYRQFITRIPVITGATRGSTRVSVNTLDTSINPRHTPLNAAGATRFGPPTPAEESYLAGQLAGVKWGDTIRISLNVPWALKLERTSLTQGPYYMLKMAFYATTDYVRRINKIFA